MSNRPLVTAQGLTGLLPDTTEPVPLQPGYAKIVDGTTYVVRAGKWTRIENDGASLPSPGPIPETVDPVELANSLLYLSIDLSFARPAALLNPVAMQPHFYDYVSFNGPFRYRDTGGWTCVRSGTYMMSVTLYQLADVQDDCEFTIFAVPYDTRKPRIALLRYSAVVGGIRQETALNAFGTNFGGDAAIQLARGDEFAFEIEFNKRGALGNTLEVTEADVPAFINASVTMIPMFLLDDQGAEGSNVGDGAMVNNLEFSSVYTTGIPVQVDTSGTPARVRVRLASVVHRVAEDATDPDSGVAIAPGLSVPLPFSSAWVECTLPRGNVNAWEGLLPLPDTSSLPPRDEATGVPTVQLIAQAQAFAADGYSGAAQQQLVSFIAYTTNDPPPIGGGGGEGG